MTRTTLAHTLAATLFVGTLAAAVHATPAPVDAAKKPAPTATATATQVPTVTPTATLTPVPTATNTPEPTATATITPTNTPLPFTVKALVDPSTMPYNSPATLLGQTQPGAICWPSVVYNDGSAPTSFSSSSSE